MTHKENIGKTLLNYQYEECEIMGIFPQDENLYMVKTPSHNWERGGCELWTDEDYERYFTAQDEIKQSIIRRAEQDEKDKERKQKLLLEKQAEENLYGFDADMAPMQRGKVLKCLLKLLNYQNYGILSRKDHIIKRLQGGSTLKIKESKRYGTIRMLLFPDGKTYTDLTKTEYDFAEYLVKTSSINT